MNQECARDERIETFRNAVFRACGRYLNTECTRSVLQQILVDVQGYLTDEQLAQAARTEIPTAEELRAGRTTGIDYRAETLWLRLSKMGLPGCAPFPGHPAFPPQGNGGSTFTPSWDEVIESMGESSRSQLKRKLEDDSPTA